MEMTSQSPTPETLSFVYRNFYDVPRILVLSAGQRRFVLDCKFDEARDEYPDLYHVYQMGDDFVPPPGSWESIVNDAKEYLGTIAIAKVQFDDTRRQHVKSQSILEILDKAR
jgi:hypothetical protein